MPVHRSRVDLDSIWLEIKYIRRMKRLLSDMNVLITGGTSGLGRSLVEQLLDRNCQVTSIARNEKSMITDERFRHFPADFADLSTLRNVIQDMKQEKLHFDILINNGGTFYILGKYTQSSQTSIKSIHLHSITSSLR